MDFMSTVKGSLLEGFYPAGWDMAKIDVLDSPISVKVVVSLLCSVNVESFTVLSNAIPGR